MAPWPNCSGWHDRRFSSEIGAERGQGRAAAGQDAEQRAKAGRASCDIAELCQQAMIGAADEFLQQGLLMAPPSGARMRKRLALVLVCFL
jgi:hypothetical protein